MNHNRIRAAFMLFFGIFLPMLLLYAGLFLNYTDNTIPFLAMMVLPVITLTYVLWYWRSQHKTWVPILFIALGMGLFFLLLILVNIP